jgi:hypothetical protein
MKRIIGSAAALALLVAAVTTPVDLTGIVIGPFLMMALGAGASWWAAYRFGAQTSDQEMYAGMFAAGAVGAGGLAGVLLMLVVTSWIMDTVPVPQISMAMTQFSSHGGVLIGLLLALTDFIFAMTGGVFGLLMYEYRHAIGRTRH